MDYYVYMFSPCGFEKFSVCHALHSPSMLVVLCSWDQLKVSFQFFLNWGIWGYPPKNPFIMFIDGFSWIFHYTSIQLLGYPYGNPELRLVVAFSDARLLARLVFYGDLSEGEEREAKIATVALQVDSCWQDIVYVYVCLCMFIAHASRLNVWLLIMCCQNYSRFFLSVSCWNIPDYILDDPEG